MYPTIPKNNIKKEHSKVSPQIATTLLVAGF
jgi:hypothetical protein